MILGAYAVHYVLLQCSEVQGVCGTDEPRIMTGSHEDTDVAQEMLI